MAIPWQRRQRITTAAFVASGVLLLALVGVMIYVGLVARDTEQRRNQVEQAVNHLRQLLLALVDAETGVRGYAITRDPSYLEPYHWSISAIEPILQTVRPLTAVTDTRSGDHLRRLIADRRMALQQVVDTANAEGSEAAAIVIREGGGKVLMDEIRTVIDEEIEANEVEIARLATLDQANTVFLGTSVAGVVLVGAILSIVQFGVFRAEIARRGKTETDLQARNAEIHNLSELANALHATHQPEEGFAVIEAFAGRLLGVPGALYTYNNSRDQLTLVADWESAASAAALPASFPPDQCWALRRGVPQSGRRGVGTINCMHVEDTAHSYLCIPIQGQGKVYGMLHLLSANPDPEVAFEGIWETARGLTEQLSLALANVELRERLRNMAIRDGLTGLYNRRFLQEVLDRELSRAERNGTKLALALIDIDHFKSFNDRYGHAVGDEVLKRVATFLSGAVRKSDIVCRFGGEELVVVLPDCDLGRGHSVCEKLREGIARLDVSDIHRDLPAVTASFGVTAYPDVCSDKDRLVESADAAMYEAKRAGRDRVVMAQPSNGDVAHDDEPKAARA
jgi:diguanylate cyclase (GGDEF)-like protein